MGDIHFDDRVFELLFNKRLFIESSANTATAVALTKIGGPNDIKCAYRDVLVIYDGDALASYALFADEQRAGQLTNIEKAFATLSI